MAYTLNRRLAELIDSSGQLNTGKISNGYISTDHFANNSITQGKLHSTFVLPSSALSGVDTDSVSEGSTNIYFTNARADARIAAANTGDLSEGSNLYYTDARADARIAAATTDDLSEGSSNLYYTDARADARVALIVDSAPGTLNTLNELAAALGDDANFSTTITNSIALKAPLASPAFNSGTANVVASFTSTDGTGAIQLADNAGNVELAAVGNDFHIQNAGSAAKMVVLNSGNVGIGISSISQPSPGATTLAIKGTDNNKAGAIRLYSANDSVAAYIYPDSVNGLSINTSTSHPIIFRTVGDEKMRITTDGTVGIGATSGEANLVVRDKTNGTHKGGRIGFGIHEAGALQIYDAVTMSRTAGSTVTDSTASGGQNVTLSSGQLYGPYHTLPRGSYRLCVKMKTTNASYTGDAARLTCHVSSGTVIPESRIIKGVDFGTNNKWQSFSVPFQVVGAATNAIEFYLFALNSQAISVDYFFIMNDTDSYSTRVYGNQIVDGNVGIGTTNPSSKLEVNGELEISPAEPTIHLNRGNGSYSWKIVNGGGVDHTLSTFNIANNAGTAVITALDNGKVGIGTNNPDSNLHIKSTADVKLTLETDEDSDCWINFSGATSEASIGYEPSTNMLKFVNAADGVTSNVRMSIDTSGRVGINQAPLSNNFALQVTGLGGASHDARTVYFKGAGNHTSIGSTGPTLVLQNTNSTANNIVKLSFESASSGETVSINAINTNHSSHYGDMAFNTRGSGGYSEKMRIMANGMVGIGTDNPAAALEVVRGSAGYAGIFGAPQGSGKVILFKDNHASPTKYNWLFGTQYNVNNAFEITPSTVVGGYTFSTPSILVTETGAVGIKSSAPSSRLELGTLPDDDWITFEQSGRKNALGGYFSSSSTNTLWKIKMTTGATNGAMNEIFQLSSAGALTFLQNSAKAPIEFNGTGTGTYNKTVLYTGQNNTSGDYNNGVHIEMGRLTDSSTAEIRAFVVGARGGQSSFKVTERAAGVTQADGDYLVKMYDLNADGFIDLCTGQATPLVKTRITSYGTNYFTPAGTTTTNRAMVSVGSNNGAKAGILNVDSSSTSVHGGIRHRMAAGTQYLNVCSTHTGSGSIPYWHIKTNIYYNQNVMFVARVHGYAYGNSGHVIDMQRSGYAYSGSSTSLVGSQFVNNGSGTVDTLVPYYTSAGQLCFRAYAGASSYYTGWAFDIKMQSPTGYNHDFVVDAHHMNNTSGNYYT